MIRTPAELMAARVALGLSREELAGLADTTAAEIKNREHTKARGLPQNVLDSIETLRNAQHALAERLLSCDAIVTFWTDSHLEEHGFDFDRLAPTSSFHRAAAALAHAESGRIVLCYAHGLFLDYCKEDPEKGRPAKPNTPEVRARWAIEWQKGYAVEMNPGVRV
jgi:transcriptional regulator with XRE-family HTH domain